MPAPTAPAPPVFYGRACRIGRYDVGGVIGRGTYGVVHRARDSATGEVVALKRLNVAFEEKRGEGMPLTALREVGVLQEIKHPNVVRLLDVAVGGPATGGDAAEAPSAPAATTTTPSMGSIYWVFEYMPFDLEHVVDRLGYRFKPSEVKAVARQLLAGLEALHARHLMHRDVKLANLLYDNAGTVKICDYGLARRYSTPRGASTPNVCTLWYRAPEVLVGGGRYDAAIDVWAAGCVVAELFLGRPLFPGSTEAEQLGRLYACLGPPSPKDADRLAALCDVRRGGGLAAAAVAAAGEQHPHGPQRHAALEVILPTATPATHAFLRRLLQYKPERRPKAAAALGDVWFDEMPYAANAAVMPVFDTPSNLPGGGAGGRRGGKRPHAEDERARPADRGRGGGGRAEGGKTRTPPRKRRKLRDMLVAYDSD